MIICSRCPSSCSLHTSSKTHADLASCCTTLFGTLIIPKIYTGLPACHLNMLYNRYLGIMQTAMIFKMGSLMLNPVLCWCLTVYTTGLVQRTVQHSSRVLWWFATRCVVLFIARFKVARRPRWVLRVFVCCSRQSKALWYVGSLAG